MKKYLKYGLFVLAGLILGAGIMLLILPMSAAQPFGGREDTPPDAGSEAAVTLAFDAAEALRDGDFAALSKLVHPERGLVVTPYSTVNLTSDQWFTAADVTALASDATSYVWGLNPITGEMLELSPSQFFSKHLYDRDYAHASVVTVNTLATQGNALENVSEVFPEAIFVDLHDPGQEGVWSTLRLVFESYRGELRLVALIHSQYTV